MKGLECGKESFFQSCVLRGKRLKNLSMQVQNCIFESSVSLKYFQALLREHWVGVSGTGMPPNECESSSRVFLPMLCFSIAANVPYMDSRFETPFSELVVTPYRSVIHCGKFGLTDDSPWGYILTPVMPAAAASAITSGVTEGWSWEDDELALLISQAPKI